MVLIPIVDFIDLKLNQQEKIYPLREYLGLSQVGHPCHRYLQHYHYWTFKSQHSARIERLFGFGHMMEQYMIDDLASVGIIVKSSQAEAIGTGGHWKGHLDGIGYRNDTPDYRFLVEFKTHNDKSFKDLKKKGVKASKPIHYDQCQAYMGYFKLPSCFYLAYNKNTSEYEYTIIPFDKEHFEDLRRKELEVITADTFLPRIGNNTPAWFECKMCDARKVCFNKEEPIISCRTCEYVDVVDKGGWICSMDQRALSKADQIKGCGKYKLAGMFNEA